MEAQDLGPAGLSLYSNPRGLYPFQGELVGYSYLRPRNLAVVDTGLGKQAPVSEPVLTPGGWMVMGDIRPGDFVIGSNGQPTRVLGVHPQRERTVYRIEFSDGSWTRCGPDHLWAVGSRRSRLAADGRQVSGWHHEVLSTSQIITRRVKSPAGRRRFCIPMCAPVEHPESVLPIEPYALGVILGDGSITRHGSAHITTDTTIIERIVGGDDHRITSHPSDGISVLWSREWQEGLCALGLASKRSWEKHVPVEYLHASVEQRRALLAGLLDTDGHPMRDGGIEFSSASEELANAVAELVESLGGSARRRPPKDTSYVNASGDRVACRPSWIVNVKLSDNPFRLERKASRWVQPTKYPPARWIESITAVDDEDSVCISVEANDGLYLTRHHIVTHNTHIGLATAALLVEDNLVDLVIVVAEGNKVDEWMDDIAAYTRMKATKYKGSPTRRRNILAKFDAQMLVMTYQTARSDLVTSVEKMHPGFLFDFVTGKRLFIIYDEATLLGGLTSGLHKVHRMLVHSTGARAIGLTATPVTASPENFYALGLIFCPDLVGSIADFHKAHVVRFDSFGNPAQFRDIDLLAEKMSPILLRKRKTDADVVHQFPREVEEFVRTVLNAEHRAVYDELVALIEQMGDQEEIDPRLCFNLLRSFANHPRSLIESGSIVADRFFETHKVADIEQLVCAKSESVVRQVRQIVSQDGDNQVVVFSDSVTVLKGLMDDLVKAKIEFAQYHGGLSHDRREEEKLDFKSGRKRVLLASSAAERGVNLPEANYIINYDVPLLHSSYIQRLSRASRIDSGTSDDILVVKTFIASHTVEDGAVAAWKRRNRDSDKLIDFDVDETDQHFVTAAARAALIREASRRPAS